MSSLSAIAGFLATGFAWSAAVVVALAGVRVRLNLPQSRRPPAARRWPYRKPSRNWRSEMSQKRLRYGALAQAEPPCWPPRFSSRQQPPHRVSDHNTPPYPIAKRALFAGVARRLGATDLDTKPHSGPSRNRAELPQNPRM